MYSGDEYYGDEITSPLYRQAYYGNSTGGYDADDEPMVVLRCGFCAAEIEFYTDVNIGAADTYTFGEYEVATCSCGANFGDGNTLDIVYA